jgi:uncharacterized protein YraI
MTRSKFAFVSGAWVLIVAAFVGLASPASKHTSYETTVDTPLRKGPGTGYEVIRTIPKNFRIDVVSREGPWLKVESLHGREPGYLDERDVRPVTAASTPSTVSSRAGEYITTGEVNLRAGPGTKYKVLTRIPKNTRIHVVRTEGNWLRVESKTGNPPGYIDNRFATKTPPER